MQVEEFEDEFGPEKILEVYDPKTGMKGVTVIHNTALGPGKGGIRMTPTVDVSEVYRLARTMTWKNSLAELPFGGAKSGIKAAPQSKEEKKAIIESFARAIKPISPSQYVAAPDINTSEREMKWYAEANGSWKSTTGKPADMCVKPGEKCGIPHEYGSTGLGVAYATLIAVQHEGRDIQNATIAIEGFGNVGTFAARHLEKLGARIVAVSDSRGAIYNEKGLDIRKLEKVKSEQKTVTMYKPGTILDGKKLFELNVDILIPGALPDVITKKNVNKIKAPLIIEAANIPMIPKMEEILHRKGIMVVPDFVANAGGVISSYAEYKGYNPKDMYTLVEKKIMKNTEKVLNKSKKDKTMPRDAAMEIAIDRVKKAMSRKK